MGRPKAPHRFAEDKRFVLPTHYFGVEFEYERVNHHDLPDEPWAKFWQHKEDHSLHDRGAEYVFNGPLFGSDASDAVFGLMKHASKNEWHSTTRCGLHVHVDCRDLMPAQLVGMLTLYALYEPAIYNFVGDGREQSIFCRPWYMCSGAVDIATDVVASILDSRDFEERWATLVNNDERRYAGLNLQSLGSLGTVEWRQLRTPTSFGRAIDWINIALGFKAAALNLPVSNIEILSEFRRMGPLAYAAAYFPKTVFELLMYDNFAKEVQEIGYPVAIDVLRGKGGAAWDQAKPPTRAFEPAKRYILLRSKEYAAAQAAVLRAQMDEYQVAGGQAGVMPADIHWDNNAAAREVDLIIRNAGNGMEARLNEARAAMQRAVNAPAPAAPRLNVPRLRR